MALTYHVDIESGKIWYQGEWVQPTPQYGQKVLESTSHLTFTIDYPLTNPKIVELVHVDNSPWTERQIVEAICQAYSDVYSEEGEDPGLVPGMLNRAKSNGKYGIWGHFLSDLILEDIEQMQDGNWQLSVGS